MDKSVLSNDRINIIRAKFLARLAAILIDSFLIFILTFVVIACARFFYRYIPFELTFIVFAILYSVTMISLKGYTVGKMMCGLKVEKKDGRSVGFFDACIREFIGKFFIAIIFPYGTVWFLLHRQGKDKLIALLALFFIIVLLIIFLIHYLIKKRTWYDYFAHTIVVFNTDFSNRARLIMSLVFALSGIIIGTKAIQVISIINIGKEMSSYGYTETLYKDRNPSSLKEISALNQNEDSEYVQWLDIHGESPRDYAIKKASQHHITVFGEKHFNRGQVQFLHEIINDLYHRAGVRCIALEFCNHEDNEAIDRLITAPEYDRERALQIGRNHGWHSWGCKEYWEIFEKVWQLNKSLSKEQRKMRIVGIDSQVDRSVALVFPGSDFIEGALWEKLRVIRVFLTLPKLVYRDELMAKQVEKEIIDKNERGIVWVGKNHSLIRYKQPFYKKGRMAYILYKKYGDNIFQINFHSEYTTIEDTDGTSTGPGFSDFMERIMAVRNHKPVGFDTGESPFMMLRDSTTYYYNYQPQVCFGDITSGFIYLESMEKFQQCRWAEGFITSKMYAKYKPFYEGRAVRKFNSAQEVNDYFRQRYH